MRQVQEVTNVRETQERPSIWAQVWTQAQYLNLALTIAGQMLVGGLYLTAQIIWTIANFISLIRDFVLQRPTADIVKDSGMCALSVSLVILRILGIY